MRSFPPNIDPNLFSLSAVVVGIALIGDFTVDELNSIGNWIMLVGQYIETVVAQRALIENRMQAAADSKQPSDDDEQKNTDKDSKNSNDSKDDQDIDNSDQLNLILEAIEVMKAEIAALKKKDECDK